MTQLQRYRAIQRVAHNRAAELLGDAPRYAKACALLVNAIQYLTFNDEESLRDSIDIYDEAIAQIEKLVAETKGMQG